jgi:predicted nucleotide-binding protein (sugar kinase/HSP70/actin superfamily)
MQTQSAQQWQDHNPRTFTEEDRSNVTLLTSGLPIHVLELVKKTVAMGGLYFEIMPEPDYKSLQYGREFGNRGQCNPTYFTVGNLIKHLVDMRDNQGMSTEDIIKNYAFVTAGGCGPCRMGMYATEYRKALVDSGFEGFRVLILSRSGDVEDVLMDGLKMNNKELLKFFLSIFIGDVLNTVNIQNRPYEIEKGHVDQVCIEARSILEKGIQSGKWIKGLWAARKKLKSMQLDRSQKRPTVHIMGEFWAKTTDGEGNYHLFRFIEEEGGVVSSETITDWLIHQMWRARWMDRRKSESFLPTKSYLSIWAFETILKLVFKTICLLLGAKIHLSDHGKLAKEVSPYFDLHLDGGEDHMEVAHHLHIAKHKLADLIISVKPFTCLSSSSVSDGVQSKISDLYPATEFISVETNGDGAANFYSRIQMALQKVVTRDIH